jgi:hypothetical protein
MSSSETTTDTVQKDLKDPTTPNMTEDSKTVQAKVRSSTSCECILETMVERSLS